MEKRLIITSSVHWGIWNTFVELFKWSGRCFFATTHVSDINFTFEKTGIQVNPVQQNTGAFTTYIFGSSLIIYGDWTFQAFVLLRFRPLWLDLVNHLSWIHPWSTCSLIYRDARESFSILTLSFVFRASTVESTDRRQDRPTMRRTA